MHVQPGVPMFRVTVGSALALWSLATDAEASTFRALSLGELVDDSVAVVQVKVLSTRSAWTDQHDLRTFAEIEVVRSLDGDLRPGERVVVAEVGGTVGDYTVQAIGFPEFAAGEELVVFLTHWQGPASDWRVSGYGQGFYEVVRDRVGAETLIPAPVQGHRPGERVDTLDVPVPRGTTVDALQNAVRSLRP